MRLFPNRELSAKCKTTDTPILCACHHVPMKFKAEDLEKAREANLVLCDVCRHIDLGWAREMLAQMNEAQRVHEELAKKDPWETLKVARLPDLLAIVAKSMESTIRDYNSHPWNYKSICQGKLDLAKRAPG